MSHFLRYIGKLKTFCSKSTITVSDGASLFTSKPVPLPRLFCLLPITYICPALSCAPPGCTPTPEPAKRCSDPPCSPPPDTKIMWASLTRGKQTPGARRASPRRKSPHSLRNCSCSIVSSPFGLVVPLIVPGPMAAPKKRGFLPAPSPRTFLYFLLSFFLENSQKQVFCTMS